MYKVGDVKRFLSPKNDRYEIKEIIENPGVKFTYDFDGGVCPDCKKKCKITKTYDFKRIYVMQNKDGEIGYKGEMADGELVRMPDTTFYPEKIKEMENKLKQKSQYLAGVSIGD